MKIGETTKMGAVPAFAIDDYFEASLRYSVANPDREAIADLVAYEMMKYRVTEPDDYSKVLVTQIGIDSVWRMVVESDSHFTMNYGFEQMADDVSDWLTRYKIWKDEE